MASAMIRKQVELFGTRLVESAYRSAADLPEHSHRFANVTIVLAGELTEWSGGQSHRCGAGSIVVKPAGTIHANRIGPDGARTFAIELTGSSARVPRIEPGVYRWVNGGRLTPMMLELLRTAERAGIEPLLGAIRCVLARLTDAPPVQPGRPELAPEMGPDWLRRVYPLIEASIHTPIQVQRIADRAGVHRVHLSRVFRRLHGVSVNDYIHQRRVMRLATLLVLGDMPLAKMAAELGYADQAHMSRAFSARMGMSPGAYRRLLS